MHAPRDFENSNLNLLGVNFFNRSMVFTGSALLFLVIFDEWRFSDLERMNVFLIAHAFSCLSVYAI